MKNTNNEDPAGIYLLKVNNRNTRTRRKICSKLTIKIPERRHWHLGKRKFSIKTRNLHEIKLYNPANSQSNRVFSRTSMFEKIGK